jgi:hypothetical protein
MVYEGGIPRYAADSASFKSVLVFSIVYERVLSSLEMKNARASGRFFDFFSLFLF